MPRDAFCVAAVLFAVGLAASGCASNGGNQSTSLGSGPAVVKTLAGSAWEIDAIGGQPVLDTAKTSLGFDNEGHVSGQTGCNRFTGQAEASGTAIKFTPLAMTRMACETAAMEQEQRFSQAVDKVRSWAIGPDGALKLMDAAGNAVLQLSPAKH